MIATIIKSFFMFYFCIYICFKIMKFNKTRVSSLISYALSLSLAILSYLLEIYISETKFILPLLLIWIFISAYSSKPQIAFVSVTISFAVSYSVYSSASLIIAIIIYVLFKYYLPYFTFSILSGLLQALLIFTMFRLKRFKNGMTFIFTTPTTNIATILCLLFLAALVYINIESSYYFGIVCTTFSLAFLVHWWQAQITKSYRRSLELRELESLRTELQEKNATMMRVMEENERIRHINHRDNGLITALDYAVTDYLITDFADEETAITRRDELLVEIERIRAGRVNSVNKNAVKAPRYDTSISFLNIFLNHMSKRATDEHVLFSVHIGTELDDFIPHIISDEDLVHLLSDLLANAFIATRDVTGRMVQLQFYKWNKHFVIEVADNGIPFEVDSLLNMGILELTTHADTGGSGIGLMDIWKTKEKYGATYHLEEYETAAPFSKKISLTFDNKNRYSVRTWRKDEILAASKRTDLQVYGQDE